MLHSEKNWKKLFIEEQSGPFKRYSDQFLKLTKKNIELHEIIEASKRHNGLSCSTASGRCSIQYIPDRGILHLKMKDVYVAGQEEHHFLNKTDFDELVGKFAKKYTPEFHTNMEYSMEKTDYYPNQTILAKHKKNLDESSEYLVLTKNKATQFSTQNYHKLYESDEYPNNKDFNSFINCLKNDQPLLSEESIFEHSIGSSIYKIHYFGDYKKDYRSYRVYYNDNQPLQQQKKLDQTSVPNLKCRQKKQNNHPKPWKEYFHSRNKLIAAKQAQRIKGQITEEIVNNHYNGKQVVYEIKHGLNKRISFRLKATSSQGVSTTSHNEYRNFLQPDAQKAHIKYTEKFENLAATGGAISDFSMLTDSPGYGYYRKITQNNRLGVTALKRSRALPSQKTIPIKVFSPIITMANHHRSSNNRNPKKRNRNLPYTTKPNQNTQKYRQ